MTAVQFELTSFPQTFFPMCQYTRHFILEKRSYQYLYENLKYVTFINAVSSQYGVKIWKYQIYNRVGGMVY
jgi:hypothetical protein